MTMMMTMMKQDGWSNSMPGVCSQWILSKVPTPTHSNTLNLIEPDHRHRHHHYHDYQHHGHANHAGTKHVWKCVFSYLNFYPLNPIAGTQLLSITNVWQTDPPFPCLKLVFSCLFDHFWQWDGMDVMRRNWQQFERLGIRSAAILSDQSTDKPMPLMMVMLMVMVMMTMTMMVMKKARRPSVCWMCPAFWLSTLVGGEPTWTDKSQRHTNQPCFVTQWNNENWSKSTICRYEMHCWE